MLSVTLPVPSRRRYAPLPGQLRAFAQIAVGGVALQSQDGFTPSGQASTSSVTDLEDPLQLHLTFTTPTLRRRVSLSTVGIGV
jgi:hypothetical protein